MTLATAPLRFSSAKHEKGVICLKPGISIRINSLDMAKAEIVRNVMPVK
jgi:hypothetical protein